MEELFISQFVLVSLKEMGNLTALTLVDSLGCRPTNIQFLHRLPRRNTTSIIVPIKREHTIQNIIIAFQSLRRRYRCLNKRRNIVIYIYISYHSKPYSYQS